MQVGTVSCRAFRWAAELERSLICRHRKNKAYPVDTHMIYRLIIQIMPWFFVLAVGLMGLGGFIQARSWGRGADLDCPYDYEPSWLGTIILFGGLFLYIGVLFSGAWLSNLLIMWGLTG